MATPGKTIVASALRLSEQACSPTDQLLVSIPDPSLYGRERNGNMTENILQMDNVRILGRRYGRELIKLKRNQALQAPFLSWIRQLSLLL